MPHRFHVDKLGTSDRIGLGAETVRHLHVLGVSSGSEVVLFDGTGGEVLARIEHLSRRSGEACVLGRTHGRRGPALELTLACAVPKGRRMDTLVRMCAELGVRRIVPLLARRSVVRPGPETGHSHKLDRWRKICVAASEQSGRDTVTAVEPPTPLAHLAREIDAYDLAVVLSPDDAAPPLPDVLSRHGLTHPQFRGAPASLSPRPPLAGGEGKGEGGGHREDSLTPTLSRGEREHAQGGVKSLLILVGPEGGFTSEEVGQLAGSGAAVARLTRDILRVETAGVVASSVAMVLFGDAQAPGCDT